MKTKYSITVILIILLAFAIACNTKNDSAVDNPEVLGTGVSFNLNKLSFTENVPRLYSKISSIDSLEEKFQKYEQFPFQDELNDISFRVLNNKSLNVKIPEYEYGFVFEGNCKDSIAVFNNLYFDCMKTLALSSGEIVAITATSEYINEKVRDSAVASLKKLYGTPILEFDDQSEFNEKILSWAPKNLIVEVNNSQGFSVSASANGDSKSEIYYRLDLLIVQTKQLHDLVQAHVHIYNDNFEQDYIQRLANSEFLPKLLNIQHILMLQ